FELVATAGTARALRRIGIPVQTVRKVVEGSPNVVDMLGDGGIQLVINTPGGRGTRVDGYEIRAAATAHRVPCITTMAGASAAVQSIAQAQAVEPVALQDLHVYEAIGAAPAGA
ncbi:MAG TPA: hypothetical protein VGI72_08175, partial [Gaiellales bacterium]